MANNITEWQEEMGNLQRIIDHLFAEGYLSEKSYDMIFDGIYNENQIIENCINDQDT
jgi:hypothetical protein